MGGAIIGRVLLVEDFFLQCAVQNPASLAEGEVLAGMLLLPVREAGEAGNDVGQLVTERAAARLIDVAGVFDEMLPAGELLLVILVILILVKPILPPWTAHGPGEEEVFFGVQQMWADRRDVDPQLA